MLIDYNSSRLLYSDIALSCGQNEERHVSQMMNMSQKHCEWWRVDLRGAFTAFGHKHDMTPPLKHAVLALYVMTS